MIRSALPEGNGYRSAVDSWKAKSKSRKRIERGQMNVLKAMSRSPIVIKEIINLGGQLQRR